MLDLDLFRQQFSHQAQEHMRHFLAHLLERRNAVGLELGRDRIDVGLVDLIPRAFLPTRIMRITALAPLPGRPQICELFGCLRPDELRR